MSAMLSVRELTVSFPGPSDHVTAVDRASFDIAAGEMVALVGQSGSGKTLTALSLPGLLPHGAVLSSDSSIQFNEVELAHLPEPELRKYRGTRIGMIFQDPMASLNPVLRIGHQLVETLRAHFPISSAEARHRAIALLTDAGLADPEGRMAAFPHQLSGGMRQRVMIALALAGEPQLLIADEPTTALDVTVQAQILELLDRLRAERGLAILLITHDLAIAAGHADRIMVMHEGSIVESGTSRALIEHPRHPCSIELMASSPRIDAEEPG